MKCISLLLGVVFCLALVGCTHTPVTPTSRAKPTPTNKSPYIFEVPEIPERQDLIPVTLYFYNPLTRGDKLSLSVRGNSGSTTVLELLVDGDYAITAFGGRVRTEGTGPISFTITRRNGETFTHSQVIKIQVAHSDNILRIPENSTGTNEVKTKYGAGRFDLAFSVENNMAKHGYIRHISLMGTRGEMKLALTPYTSANPVFVFDSSTTLEDLKITVAQ